MIDGETFRNIAIRAKGNTSLSSVKQMDSSRYSFKVEFDHYNNGSTYHGLDKLSLNNLIQDNTMMKDYLAYTLMAKNGADAPLCSFAYITVNGEDWGLYLAVEGIEDSFLTRNYGNERGELYKPDSMSFGGGRGNGRDFDVENFRVSDDEETETDATEADTAAGGSSDAEANAASASGQPGQDDNAQTPDFGDGQMPDGMPGNIPQGGFPGGGQMPDFDGGQMPDFANADFSGEGMPGGGGGMPGGGGPGGFNFGMGSSDVKLQYIDDDPSSYSNIFDNAKTDISAADEKRLIQSLKDLSEENNLEDILDIDEVIDYFVVHNFLCNGDSYTGAMIHNYYLHETGGKLSMIPWDYNLAFGTFQASDDATDTVNAPIDTPVSGGSTDDRPMMDWITNNEIYLEQYHAVFRTFLENTYFDRMITEAYELIASYVEKDPTKFCTYEDFEAGVEAIRSFCSLRKESVQAQLDGNIPSTTEGQREDSSSLVDGSALDLSLMGSMGGGTGGNPGDNRGQGGGFGGRSDRGDSSGDRGERQQGSDAENATTAPSGNMPGGDMQPPGGGMQPPGFDGNFSNTLDRNSLILIGVSVVLLLAAVIFVKRYRRFGVA